MTTTTDKPKTVATEPKAAKVEPKTTKADKPVGVAPSLGTQLAKEVKPEVKTVDPKVQLQIDAAIKLLTDLGYKVSPPKVGGTSNARVKVVANGVTYDKLTEALRAHDFNVDKDWVYCRGKLNKEGSCTMEKADKTTVTFTLA